MPRVGHVRLDCSPGGAMAVTLPFIDGKCRPGRTATGLGRPSPGSRPWDERK